MKALEISIIICASIIMILVMTNQYLKTANGSINLTLKHIQYIFIAITMLDILIYSFLDKKKNTIFLLLFYAVMGVLYIVFKNAGRI